MKALNPAEPAARARVRRGYNAPTSMVERIGKSYDPLVGREVAKTLVEERIGKGGMGIVYRVRHRTLLKDLALKVLAIDSGITQRQLEQFFVEARAQARVEHPNVVQVLDVDRFNNWFYILMQLVQGPSLREAMDAEQGLPWPLVAKIAMGTAAGLDAAHTCDPPLIHRDIKPNNILVGPGWEAKVLDFGLVFQADGEELDKTLVAAGTTHYVPPELLVGRQPTPASDIYSLGITVFEAVANRRVFPGKTQQEVLKARLTEHPPKLIDVMDDIPKAFSELVDHMLKPKPEKRPPTAYEVAERFRDLYYDSGQTELPPVPTIDGEALPPGGKLLTERPADAQVAAWAKQGKLLHVCRKCDVHFLKRSYEEGRVVPCPACNSKLTVPDRLGLETYLKAQGLRARSGGVSGRRPVPSTGRVSKSAAKTTSDRRPLSLPEHDSSSTEHPVPGALLLDPIDRLHLPPALLGRDHVIARVFECGNGQVTCIRIHGEPGLGKTRMLEELRFPFKERALLSCGMEPPREGPPSPYAPFDQLGRELVTAMQERIKALLLPVAKLHGPWILRLTGPMAGVEALEGIEVGPEQGDKVIAAFEALLEAVLGTEGATLLFDDIDDLREEVVPLWEKLIDKIDQHQTLLVATHTRQLPAHVAGPLRKLTEESFVLDALQSAVYMPLFTSIFGLSPYPKELAETVDLVGEGNPARMIEVLKSFVAGGQLIEGGEEGWRWSQEYLQRGMLNLPDDIDRQLVARAEAMPKLHKEVLGVLARVGGELTPKQLAEAGGFSTGHLAMALKDLGDGRVIRTWNEKLTLMSQALGDRYADTVPEPKRAGLHAQVAKLLEPDDGPEAAGPWQASRVAHHLTEGGEETRAIVYRLRAARAFVEQGLFERAIADYEAALSAVEALGKSKKLSLLRRRGDDTPSAAEVRLELGEVYTKVGDMARALPVLTQGLKLATKEKQPELAGRFQRNLALACARQADYKQALAHFAEIEKDSDLVDARLLAEMAQLRLIRDDHVKAHELLKRARSMKTAPPEHRLAVLLGLARFERRMGRWSGVLKAVKEADSVMSGDPGLREQYYALFQAQAARALCPTGDLREAGQRLEAARRHLAGLEADIELKRAAAELMLAARHREAAAKAALSLKKLADEHGRKHESAWALYYLSRATMGQPSNARKAASAALKLFEQLGSSLGRASGYMAIADCDLVLRNNDSAASKLAYARRNLDAIGLAWPKGRLEFLCSRLAYNEGDSSKSLEHLEAARQIAEEAGLELLLKRIVRVSGQLQQTA